MESEHVFVRDEVLPSWWANALDKFLSVAAFNFLLSKTNDTHLAVPASAGTGGVSIAVQGLWRFVVATVSRAHPGGAAGTYDVYVTATANDIQATPAPYTDDTDYTFALWIGAAGSTPPIVPGTVDVIRKVGSCQWDGTKITRVDQSVPAVGLHSITHHTGGTDALAPADIGAASSTALSTETTRAEAAEGANADAIAAEAARAEAAEALLAPKASPAFTGNPTAANQPAGTSNTRLATTAYADNAVAVETSRAEAAEGLLAPKASPALTGTPTAPTQAAGNNTTRLATTAFAAAAVAVEAARAQGVENSLVSDVLARPINVSGLVAEDAGTFTTATGIGPGAAQTYTINHGLGVAPVVALASFGHQDVRATVTDRSATWIKVTAVNVGTGPSSIPAGERIDWLVKK